MKPYIKERNVGIPSQAIYLGIPSLTKNKYLFTITYNLSLPHRGISSSLFIPISGSANIPSLPIPTWQISRDLATLDCSYSIKYRSNEQQVSVLSLAVYSGSLKGGNPPALNKF